MAAPNLNSSNFTTEINVINGKDYTVTPYFTANASGAYSNGVMLQANSAPSGLAAASTVATSVTSSTTLVNVTGLAVPLVAGGTYNFRVHLNGTANAAGGAKFAIAASNGLTATSIYYNGINYNGGTIGANTSTTTLGTAVGAATAVYTDAFIDGTIVVGVAGTLNVQIAQNASNAAATTAAVNSNITVTRVS